MVVRKSESLADVDRAALERRSFLTRGGVCAVTGYVLYANKLMDANARVDAKSLVGVKMPNRDRFYVDDRPDAKNSRCMKNCLKRQSSR